MWERSPCLLYVHTYVLPAIGIAKQRVVTLPPTFHATSRNLETIERKTTCRPHRKVTYAMFRKRRNMTDEKDLIKDSDGYR